MIISIVRGKLIRFVRMITRILDDAFIDFTKDFRRKALSEMDHAGAIEGILIFVAGKAAKELQIGRFSNLGYCFFVRISILNLNE